MKEFTIMVSDKTAREMDNLAEKGYISARSGYAAYCLALYSRPIKGERWVRIGDDMWKRLPEKLSYRPK